VFAAVLMQGSQVLNSYTLVWWQEKYISLRRPESHSSMQSSTFNKPFRFYQVLYALLGVAQATFTYLLSVLPLPSELVVCSRFPLAASSWTYLPSMSRAICTTTRW
jgi:hypothetical protein